MNYRNMPSAVHKLAMIPTDWTRNDWFNYRELGLGAEHIPMLMEIVRNSTEFWTDDADDGEYYIPLHAWRALVQLQAEEAIPLLVDTLHWIGEIDSELIQEEMPVVFGRIGVAAAPLLGEYLNHTENEMWGRLAAAEGISNIANRSPEYRDEAVRVLCIALERFEQEDPVFNAFVINALAQLNAAEAAPLVEAAYRSERVDESILGDWEDFQVLTGMLKERQTPRRPPTLFKDAFTDGIFEDHNLVIGDFSKMPPEPDKKKFRSIARKAEKKEKKKRKEAKTKQKKNSKKK